MALDPRISLAIASPTLTPAVNAFENALMNSQTRDIRRQQAEQAALMNPLILEQQQVATDNARQMQRLGNTALTAQQLRPLLVEGIESGDTTRAQAFLTRNLTDIQARQAAGENIDAAETIQALELLESGGAQQLLSDSDNLIQIARDRGLLGGGAQQQANSQFGAQKTFKDSKGNLFFGTTRMNPTTGAVQSVLASVDGSNKQPDGSVSLVSELGQTSGEQFKSKVELTQQTEDIKTDAKGKGAALTAGVTQGVKAFQKMPLVRTAIGNYNEAIAALDAGAETGTLDQYTPNLTRASKELSNVIKRLGLDVVGNTTFGALSESELAFALKAAIPDNLQPAELKEWLIAKRNAQQKILAGLDEMSTFLGGGEKTIADWKNMQAVKSLAGNEQSAVDNQQPAPQVTPTTAEQSRSEADILSQYGVN